MSAWLFICLGHTFAIDPCLSVILKWMVIKLIKMVMKLKGSQHIEKMIKLWYLFWTTAKFCKEDRKIFNFKIITNKNRKIWAELFFTLAPLNTMQYYCKYILRTNLLPNNYIFTRNNMKHHKPPPATLKAPWMSQPAALLSALACCVSHCTLFQLWPRHADRQTTW